MSVASLWVVLVGASFVLGISLVAAFVVPAPLELLAALAGLSSFAGVAYSMLSLASFYNSLRAVITAVAFVLVAAAAGWALSSGLLERWSPDEQPIAAPTIPSQPAKGVALILVACTEPSRYDLFATARLLAELRDADIFLPSLLTLPLMFFAQKVRYRSVGGRVFGEDQLRTVAEKVGETVGRDVVTLVSWATCTGSRRMAVQVARAAGAGYRKILIVNAEVGESLDFAHAQVETDALRLDAQGIELVFAPSLAGSETLIAMLANQVLSALQDTAVPSAILVGHGQAEDLSRQNPRFDEAEMALLTRLRMRLLDAGLPEAHVRIAWAEWTEPDVTDELRHLIGSGSTRVVVLPALFPLDTLTTLLDIDVAVRQARASEEVSVVTLPTWKDDPSVVAELARLAKQALEEVG